MMGMFSTFIKLWTLPMLINTFISVDEKFFQSFVPDALASVRDCYIK